MSNDITIKNVALVRDMIRQKECLDKPFWATSRSTKDVVTDYDHFPYTRWFRGDYTSDYPIIAEREAGFRSRHDSCYKIDRPRSVNDDDTPRVCFQDACSIVYPCNPHNPSDNPVKDRLYPSRKSLHIYR